MEEIKELDDKYMVIKTEDLDFFYSGFVKEDYFDDEEQAFIDTIPFKTVVEQIQKTREANGKSDNHYVVLNMDDEIDLNHLRRTINKKQSFLPISACKVKDIAVDLVNAILITKE